MKNWELTNGEYFRAMDILSFIQFLKNQLHTHIIPTNANDFERVVHAFILHERSEQSKEVQRQNNRRKQ